MDWPGDRGAVGGGGSDAGGARWINPPTTMVHVERRVQASMRGVSYREHYKFVPLKQISPNLQHAVVSAEDARFYEHHGFDWHQVQVDAAGDLEGGRVRSASTRSLKLTS